MRSIAQRALHSASKKQEFISLSYIYHQGDENKLPFPELSQQGRSLHKITKLLRETPIAAVLTPSFERPVIQLLRHEGHKVFKTNEAHLSASIVGQLTANVFDYWRNDMHLELPGCGDDISIWIDPSIDRLLQYSESINAAYVGLGMEEHATVKALAGLGLTTAHSLDSGFWLTRD